MMNFYCVILTPDFNCKLPFGCEINDVQFIIDYNGIEKTSMAYPGILCDIRNETFQFNYSMPSPLLIPESGDLCQISKLDNNIMEFRFSSNFILDKYFNFQKIWNYTWNFLYNVDLNFVNLKGFELDIKTNNQNISFDSFYFFLFQCIRCKIEFYSNGRHIKTCQDILDSYSNIEFISSLFQIQRLNSNNNLILFYSEFKTTICPLVFKNSNLSSFYTTGLADTFYKRNILAIENRTFDDLNSIIFELRIIKAEKINIDSNLLNPSVFQNLSIIYLSGSFNKIEGHSLNALIKLKQILIVKKYYRDIIHKNGIKWIRDLNAHLDVNIGNFEELETYYNNSILIRVGCFDSNTEIRSSKLFPDEDFCLYKDFPFNQLVILMENVYDYQIFTALLGSKTKRQYSCTYLWLAQYFHLFLKLEK